MRRGRTQVHEKVMRLQLALVGVGIGIGFLKFRTPNILLFKAVRFYLEHMQASFGLVPGGRRSRRRGKSQGGLSPAALECGGTTCSLYTSRKPEGLE